MESHEKYMKEALREAGFAAAEDEVPIGAIIVWNGRIIAKGHNMTERLGDPTAHAEVTAIRKATKALATHNLSGCEIFTSCEPCPMCLGAIYWAHIDKIFYGANQHDAAAVNFDDSFIYRELERKPHERHKPVENILHKEAQAPFNAWREKGDKVEY